MPTSVRVAARCIPTSHPSFLPQPSGFDSLSGFVIFHLLPTAENQNQNRQISRTAIGGRTFLHPGRFIVCFDSVIIYNRGTKPLLSANLPTSFGRRKTPLKKGRKRNLSLSSLRANSQHRDERFPSEIFPPPPYPPHPEPFSSSPRVLQTRISLVFLSPKHHSQKIGDFCLQAEDRRPHPRFWLRFIFSAAALLRAGLCVFFGGGGGWSGGERNQLIALLGFPSAIAGGSTAAAPFSCSAKSFAPVWVHKRFLSAVHLQSAPFQGGSFH